MELGPTRRSFLKSSGVLVSALSAGCLGGSGTGIDAGPQVGLDLLVDGLDQPLAFETTPSIPYQYIVDKTGMIYRRDKDDGSVELFFDVQDKMIEITDWEQGVLGLALHPQFEETRKIYLRYSAPTVPETESGYTHTFVLSEFLVTDDFTLVYAASERRLLEIPQPSRKHNSGAVSFGPDDYLYVALGDGGPYSGDRGFGHAEDWYDFIGGGNGQDVTSNLLGSILRIDVDRSEGGKPYGIPEDNPLVDAEGLDEHYAWGFRNPYRMSFDGDRLFVGDVGKMSFEEVNLVRPGGNYGWNVREGPECADLIDTRETLTNPARMLRDSRYLDEAIGELPLVPYQYCPRSTDRDQPLVDPIISYPHEADGEVVGSAVIGGYQYRDTELSDIKDMYVFGDLAAEAGGRLFAASEPTDPSSDWPFKELSIAGRDGGRLNEALLSFGRDEHGEPIVMTTRFTPGSGKAYRMV